MITETVDLKRLRMTRKHMSTSQMTDLLNLKPATCKGWLSAKHARNDTIASRIPGVGASTNSLANVVETLAGKGFSPDRISAWFGRHNPHIRGEQRPRSVFKNEQFTEVEAAAEQASEIVRVLKQTQAA